MFQDDEDDPDKTEEAKQTDTEEEKKPVKVKGDKSKDKNKDKKSKKEEKENKETKSAKASALQRDQERAKNLQFEVENEEKQTGEEENEKAEESKRDTRKAWFFNKNYDSLPQAAKDLFDSKKVSRSQKTELVNSMVQKSSTGKWQLDLQSPVLSALSRHYKSLVGEESLVFWFSIFLFFSPPKIWNKCRVLLTFRGKKNIFEPFVYQKRKAVGIPKSLMIGKLGSEKALQDAIRCGDVVEIQEIFGWTLKRNKPLFHCFYL